MNRYFKIFVCSTATISVTSAHFNYFGWLKNSLAGIKPWDDKLFDTLIDKQRSLVHGDKNIYLIRHGKYNTEAELDSEKTLTELGWKQAAETGKYLKNQNIKNPKFVHSGKIRAIESLCGILWSYDENFRRKIIKMYNLDHAVELPINELKKFSAQKSLDKPKIYEKDNRIISLVSVQPSIFASLSSYPVYMTSLINEGPPIIAPSPWKDSLKPSERQQHGEKIEQGLGTILSISFNQEEGPENLIVVCHANVIRYWLCRLLQVPLDAWLRLTLYHGSVSLVSLYTYEKTGNVSVTKIGESGHLKNNLLTTR